MRYIIVANYCRAIASDLWFGYRLDIGLGGREGVETDEKFCVVATACVVDVLVVRKYVDWRIKCVYVNM